MQLTMASTSLRILKTKTVGDCEKRSVAAACNARHVGRLQVAKHARYRAYRRGVAPETQQRLVEEGGKGVAQDGLEHDAHAEQQHGEDDDEVLPGC